MADYTPISMIRGNSTIVDSTPIVDGQILFDETRKCLFMDNGSTREKYSGLGADSNIANVEDTTTASQPYTTGEFVVVEGQLYKVTASIATGDTFSVGTNIATDTVGAELTQINADLSDFSFRNNSGQAQYSMDDGTTWQDFKHPVGTMSITANGEYDITDYASADVNVRSAIYIGSYSNDTTINVSAYGATNVNQFVLVPNRVSGEVQHNYYGADTISDTYWTLQSMSLSGNNLTIYLPKMRLICKYGNNGAVVYDNTTAISCKLLFVGTVN